MPPAIQAVQSQLSRSIDVLRQHWNNSNLYHLWHQSWIKHLVAEINDDNLPVLAAAMAYNFILALFPALIFLFALFGLLGTPENISQITQLLGRLMPEEALSLLENVLQDILQGSSGELAILSLLGALYATSRGVYMITIALNRAYDISEQKTSMITALVKSVLMTIGFGLLLFLTTNLLVFGGILLDWVAATLDLQYALFIMLSWARWLLVGAGSILLVAIIYAFLPDFSRKIRWQTTLPGAIFFIVGWYVLSQLFAYYVAHFSQYNRFYGALGGVIVLMIWMYLTSFLLLIGGEMNALFNKKKANP